MAVTSEEFIASIKRLITMPSNQNLLQDPDILAFTQRKLRDSLVPLIDSVNEEFFVTRLEEPIIEDKTEYRIPHRSIGRRLRELKLKGPGEFIWNFPMTEIERSQMYRPLGQPWAFYFYGDRIEVVPRPNVSNSYFLQMWWYLAPGRPILTTDAMQVQSVNGNEVTVDSAVSGYAANILVDFVQGTSGCPYLGIDKRIQSVNGNTFTFTAGDVPTDLDEGDWITLAQTSPLLQIPDEAVPYLETLVAMDCLGSIGDFDGKKNLSDDLKMQKENLLKLLDPRIKGEPTVLLNMYGFKRGGMWFGRNWNII